MALFLLIFDVEFLCLIRVLSVQFAILIILKVGIQVHVGYQQFWRFFLKKKE